MKKILKMLRRQRGFTMVELLVVISIIGILAAAVLAALNPAEQLKKGRDTAKKSDAATLLSALDRYQATFGCYPWANTGNTCDGTQLPAAAAAVDGTSFAAGGNLEELLNQDELKTQFTTRDSVTGASMYLSEATAGQASVCFTPESKTARAGGLGPIVSDVNGTPAGTCAAAPDGTHEADCNVCVPQ